MDFYNCPRCCLGLVLWTVGNAIIGEWQKNHQEQEAANRKAKSDSEHAEVQNAQKHGFGLCSMHRLPRKTKTCLRERLPWQRRNLERQDRIKPKVQTQAAGDWSGGNEERVDRCVVHYERDTKGGHTVANGCSKSLEGFEGRMKIVDRVGTGEGSTRTVAAPIS